MNTLRVTGCKFDSHHHIFFFRDIVLFFFITGRLRSLSNISGNVQAVASEVSTVESHQNITEMARKRVRDVDPNGGRCLVENSISLIEYCHCIPRRKMNDDKLVCVYRIH